MILSPSGSTSVLQPLTCPVLKKSYQGYKNRYLRFFLFWRGDFWSLMRFVKVFESAIRHIAVNCVVCMTKHHIFMKCIYSALWCFEFVCWFQNKTGVVSRSDLRRVLEGLTFRLTDEQFRGLIDHCVPNSGTINYQQFLDFFQEQRPAVVTFLQCMFVFFTK